MSDFDQTYETSFKLGYRPCRSCEREHPISFLSPGDGWCPQCRGEKPLEKPKTESIRQGWLRAADLLTRLSQDTGLKPSFRAVLLEEAELLKRRAS